jgi:hypothetical protein
VYKKVINMSWFKALAPIVVVGTIAYLYASLTTPRVKGECHDPYKPTTAVVTTVFGPLNANQVAMCAKYDGEKNTLEIRGELNYGNTLGTDVLYPKEVVEGSVGLGTLKDALGGKQFLTILYEGQCKNTDCVIRRIEDKGSQQVLYIACSYRPEILYPQK